MIQKQVVQVFWFKFIEIKKKTISSTVYSKRSWFSFEQKQLPIKKKICNRHMKYIIFLYVSSNSR